MTEGCMKWFFIFGITFLLIVFKTWLVTLCWAFIVPIVLPKMVASGAIVAELTMWQAFVLGMLCNLLFNSNTTYSKED